MFCKFTLLAFVAPLVSALTLDAPSNWDTSSSVTATWTSSVTADPSVWTLELTNPSFNAALAIANDVDPTTGSITLALGVVPVGGSYTLIAVNPSNISDVYATSATFSIGAAGSTSSSSVSSSASSSASKSASASSNSTTSSTKFVSATSSIPFGTTVSGTSTAAATTGSSTSSGAAASGTGSSSFNGASKLGFTSNAGSMAVMLLTVVAGAAVVAL